MTKKTNFPKRALCAVLVLVMLMGASFAYFSDYATTQVTGTAGTVAIAMDSDINLLNDEGMDILNPGDMRDGSFDITNMGNKSIDVRTTIALTALDHEGNALNFTGSETEQSEFDLYLASDVEYVEGEGYKPVAGATPLEVKSIDGNVITYVLPEYSLNGNSDEYDEVETIDGVDTFAAANDFVLVFKGAAGNEWQAASLQLDVIVEAKQHENTQAGWDIVATEQITHGSITKDVVKGEGVITENEAANGGIIVTAKDANGNDLNASSSVIKGTKADELLDALDNQGLANKEDVDLLIDVESDDFDGLAETTFDVSNVAQEGDTVVILHYDETKQEWEYIATDTVENGQVGGDFSSYSPVAIIVIPKEEGGEGAETPELETRNITLKVLDANGQEINDVSVGIADAVGGVDTFGTTFFNGTPAHSIPDGSYTINLVTLPDNTQIWPNTGFGAQNMAWLETTTLDIEGEGEYVVRLNHVIPEYTVINVVYEDGTPAELTGNASLTLYTEDYSNYMFLSQDLDGLSTNRNTKFIAPSVNGTYSIIELGGIAGEVVTSEIVINGQTEVDLVIKKPQLYNVTFNVTNNTSLPVEAFDIYVDSTRYSISDGTVLQLAGKQDGYYYSLTSENYTLSPSGFTLVDNDITVDLVISEKQAFTVTYEYDASLNIDMLNVQLIDDFGNAFFPGSVVGNTATYEGLPAGSYSVYAPDWVTPGCDAAYGELVYNGDTANYTVILTA